MCWPGKIAILFCVIFSSVFAEEEIYHFKGIHFLASYSDCDKEALTDVENLVEAMKSAVGVSGATILSESSWVFPPDGLTMVLLLSESHASIHTYPEHGSCFVDLFTCGDNCSSAKFDAALQAYLKPKTICKRLFVRDRDIQDRIADGI